MVLWEKILLLKALNFIPLNYLIESRGGNHSFSRISQEITHTWTTFKKGLILRFPEILCPHFFALSNSSILLLPDKLLHFLKPQQTRQLIFQLRSCLINYWFLTFFMNMPMSCNSPTLYWRYWSLYRYISISRSLLFLSAAALPKNIDVLKLTFPISLPWYVSLYSQWKWIYDYQKHNNWIH